ncbi:unnamed protein product [Euphydryas editha]|uniref:Reverse transcriptase n=1 Tax=Euphydryas editha TaxID=104508 RepID=A0AAU9V601_EUPED|nr:unnamed protein product [Euphydryas editha]
MRSIFQGDRLSSLWFCIALKPLSTLLEDAGLSFHLREGSKAISRLLFMNDLKLFASKKKLNCCFYKLLTDPDVDQSISRLQYGHLCLYNYRRSY